MKKIQPVVLGVLRNKNRYLLTKRNDRLHHYHGKWQLPGGGLDFGESLEDCVRREMREELALAIEEVRLIPQIYHRVYKDEWHGVLISFLHEFTMEPAKIILNEEASEYGWFTIEEAQQLDSFPYVVEYIQEAQKI